MDNKDLKTNYDTFLSEEELDSVSGGAFSPEKLMSQPTYRDAMNYLREVGLFHTPLGAFWYKKYQEHRNACEE